MHNSAAASCSATRLALHRASVAAAALHWPLKGRGTAAGLGRGGVDWWLVGLSGCLAASTAGVVFLSAKRASLQRELQTRDRELARLVVRIVTLQEMLGSLRRGAGGGAPYSAAAARAVAAAGLSASGAAHL